jgi:hypothetical protein
VTLGAGGLAINNTNVAAAINAIPGFPGTATSAGAGNTGFTATFGGALAQTDVSSLAIVSCTGACTSTVRENVKGTTAIAGWLAGSTVSIGTVADTGYTVTFNGLGDVSQLSVTNGTGGASGTVSTTTNGTSGILPTGATATVAGFGAGTFNNTGIQVTFGGVLAGSPSVGALSLTNLSSGVSGYVAETAKGGPNRNNGNQVLPTGNQPPTVTVPLSYTIPYRTPFALTGSGGDLDGDTVTYMWEQNDIGSGTNLVDNSKPTGPLFREFGTRLNAAIYNPHQSPSPGENAVDTNPTRVFPDMAQVLADNTDAKTGTCPSWNPATTPVPDAIGDCYSEFLPTSVYVGPMHFRLTVRDGHIGGGGVNSADTTVSLATGTGPFLVTEPDTDSPDYPGATTQTITWNVAGTNVPPISTSSVDVLLSTDSGASFPTVLASATDNDGSADVSLPNIDTTNARIEIRAVGNVYFDVSDSDFTIHARQDQTIDFAPLADRTFDQGDLTLSATASSGLPVSYTATGDSCTVTGNVVHFPHVGDCAITAHQAGDGNYFAAPDVERDVTVTQGIQHITFPALASRQLGAPDFDPGASASSGLPITYVASGSCTLADSHTVHLVTTGKCKIRAFQDGNDDWLSAVDVTQTFKVTNASPIATTTVLDASPSPVAAGGTLTLTATVSSSTGGPTTGSVQFYTKAGTLLAEVPIDHGTAVANVAAPGSPTVLKLYALYVDPPGNDWKGSKSPVVKVMVH